MLVFAIVTLTLGLAIGPPDLCWCICRSPNWGGEALRIDGVLSLVLTTAGVAVSATRAKGAYAVSLYYGGGFDAQRGFVPTAAVLNALAIDWVLMVIFDGVVAKHCCCGKARVYDH
jgi:hypothetical protein